MNENPANQVDIALTKDDSSFGPWMIVKHNNRRKTNPKKVERNNLDAPSAGSRFATLVDASHVPNIGEQSTEIIVSTATTNDLKSKHDLGPNSVIKPKQSKVAIHKPKSISKGHYVKPKAPPKEATAMPSSTSRVASVATRGKEKSKETEIEILRIMNRKYVGMIQAHEKEKASMEFLNQFVQNPSDEVMAFISDLRARGSLSTVHQPKPPDYTEPAGVGLDDEAANNYEVLAGCAQSVDGATVSSA
ncbi:hypothetical protein RIF29_05612 [Crotalaria pallida]|uniref:Uncharacterized protein n=1 Tax=Crotalaria pallida TaxID=3830 RepID=A0AAN9PAE4_CROPI